MKIAFLVALALCVQCASAGWLTWSSFNSRMGCMERTLSSLSSYTNTVKRAVDGDDSKLRSVESQLNSFSRTISSQSSQIRSIQGRASQLRRNSAAMKAQMNQAFSLFNSRPELNACSYSSYDILMCMLYGDDASNY
ncbi:uncharacterized protein LOC143472859 [Clavelina lepadiformis]|uniref:Uncharacterized protein n=1 Tax=Clavelina lepadiformis TaxID=159417 RepID=A0ABP0FZ95_CLALP